MEAVLHVTSVGVRGDGIADGNGERVFLPFTAPGDVVHARLGERSGEGRSGTVVALLTPGARQEPACGHFGDCGGCALQHLAPDAYASAKIAWLTAALAQHGVAADTVAPLRLLPAGTRRRARWTIRRPRRGPAEIGFLARASHRVVDMRECHVLHPALASLVAPLRGLAAMLFAPGGEGAATATRADTGVDLLIDLAVAPDLAALEAMASFAQAHDLARLSWRAPGGPPVPAAQHRPVRAVFGGTAVDLPDEPFLQASAEAEAVLVAAVCDGVGAAGPIADLYAGVGTFTFALAGAAAVHAVEGSAAAVGAIRAAAARAGPAHPVSCERRDLATRPLRPDELARFAAVVFDPPRAGARAQCQALAVSSVARIVAVSCNQATFARDARILVDGGYRLCSVQPIDGFAWSPHLELVARFERP
jgi:23S rRNA (uracil1939-C5)-methyltransferase